MFGKDFDLSASFLENNVKATATVNNRRYCAMLTGWFFTVIASGDMDNIWYKRNQKKLWVELASTDIIRQLFLWSGDG